MKRNWLLTALFLGLFYLAVGLFFGALAGSAGSTTMRSFWRVLAWLVSAAAFTVHIWYERLRWGNPPIPAALHTSIAAALGAFFLAVAANVHALLAGSGEMPKPLLLHLSLLIWPVLTLIPAFVVALVIAYLLGRAFGRDNP